VEAVLGVERVGHLALAACDQVMRPSRNSHSAATNTTHAAVHTLLIRAAARPWAPARRNRGLVVA
jgi:hypothetical protein